MECLSAASSNITPKSKGIIPEKISRGACVRNTYISTRMQIAIAVLGGVKR